VGTWAIADTFCVNMIMSMRNNLYLLGIAVNSGFHF